MNIKGLLQKGYIPFCSGMGTLVLLPCILLLSGFPAQNIFETGFLFLCLFLGISIGFVHFILLNKKLNEKNMVIDSLTEELKEKDVEYEKMRHLAATDPLTSAFNRRAGAQKLCDLFTSCTKENSPLGVIMMDIDKFKRLNDEYNHLMGDKVLVDIIIELKSVLSKEDFIIRYGGDEFLIILPGADNKRLTVLSEKMMNTVNCLVFRNEEYSAKISISLGCVSYPETQTENEIELISKADTALYRAKRSGRGKVVIYSEDNYY